MQITRSTTAKFILTTVAVAGVLAFSLVMPNAMRLFKPFLKQKNNSKYNPKPYFNSKVRTLLREGFLEEISIDGQKKLSLTQKGKHRLALYQSKEKNIKTKRVWDKKWRVVIFDVWEKTRSKRNLLRTEIKNYGFVQLQRSVWVYPYDCGEFIELLKTDLSFGKNIRYMVVEHLDHDKELRRFFKLSV